MYKKKSAGSRLEIARLGHNVADVLISRSDSESFKPKETLKKTIVNDLNLEDDWKHDKFVDGCICKRERKTLLCLQCKMFTYGRITQICPAHRNVTYLMDFICCPNCLGPNQFLTGVDIDYNKCQEFNTKMASSLYKSSNLSHNVDDNSAEEL